MADGSAVEHRTLVGDGNGIRTGGDEKIDHDGVSGSGVMRWIDPDGWGRLGWAWLIGAARGVTDAGRLATWERMIRLLPRTLPCFSCRLHCGKNIRANPMPQSCADVAPWLCRIRLAVRDQNRRSGDVTPTQTQLQDQNAPETVATAADRFDHRLQFRSLWIMDVLLFVACVLQVADWHDPRNRADVHTFIGCMLELSPVPLTLPVLPTQPWTSLQDAFRWLTDAEFLRNRLPTFLSILSNLPVRSKPVSA
jgi:hypothetical protein